MAQCIDVERNTKLLDFFVVADKPNASMSADSEFDFFDYYTPSDNSSNCKWSKTVNLGL